MMKIVLLIALLTVSGCEETRVVGQTGQNVTLPCNYDIKQHGTVDVCWGRGTISFSKCNNLLISTDGFKVKLETRVSSRYKLLGQMDQGDVSLTILDVRKEDAGRYGCRAEISGWFNDQKKHIDLEVEDLTTTPPSDPQTSSERPDDAHTTADLTTREDLPISWSDGSVTVAQQDSSGLEAVLVGVLLLLLVLVMAASLCIMARRRSRLKKPQQQQVGSSLQLHHQGSPEDNIYQIDEGAEGGDYEVCP